ncbi:hypothetical protein SeMB42_g00916 [Synchytrium endobioticum]|uniref:RING-type E3 ubiquitin transferase n=1 Tax=Synchytrium endobioticum TaxID=286115 RepID=A0A507DP62_9FUNG|nr:hypothetical protein SeMB42_g00916 [Synchytrium endobioticum]
MTGYGYDKLWTVPSNNDCDDAPSASDSNKRKRSLSFVPNSTSSSRLPTPHNHSTESIMSSASSPRDSYHLEMQGSPTSAAANHVHPHHGHASQDDIADICPICLSPYEDKTLLENCFHAFCFVCISTWTATSLRCPLCKAEIHMGIHLITSIDDFKKYDFERAKFDGRLRIGVCETSRSQPWNMHLQRRRRHNAIPLYQ